MQGCVPPRFNATLPDALAVHIPNREVLVDVDTYDLADLAELGPRQELTGAVLMPSADLVVYINGHQAKFIRHHRLGCVLFNRGDTLRLEAPNAALRSITTILPFAGTPESTP